MFEKIKEFFNKKSKVIEERKNKDTAKERLHLVLMQDRANVSADFLELMKQEIIDVIKKYVDVDEKEIDVKLTNKMNSDGTAGAPALYANIPIKNIKNETRKLNNNDLKKLKNDNKNVKNENKEATPKTGKLKNNAIKANKNKKETTNNEKNKNSVAKSYERKANTTKVNTIKSDDKKSKDTEQKDTKSNNANEK